MSFIRESLVEAIIVAFCSTAIIKAVGDCHQGSIKGCRAIHRPTRFLGRYPSMSQLKRNSFLHSGHV